MPDIAFRPVLMQEGTPDSYRNARASSTIGEKRPADKTRILTALAATGFVVIQWPLGNGHWSGGPETGTQLVCLHRNFDCVPVSGLCSTGCQAPAIRCECNALDIVFVATQRTDRLPGRRVPDPNFAISATTGQALAIRARKLRNGCPFPPAVHVRTSEVPAPPCRSPLPRFAPYCCARQMPLQVYDLQARMRWS